MEYSNSVAKEPKKCADTLSTGSTGSSTVTVVIDSNRFRRRRRRTLTQYEYCDDSGCCYYNNNNNKYGILRTTTSTVTSRITSFKRIIKMIISYILLLLALLEYIIIIPNCSAQEIIIDGEETDTNIQPPSSSLPPSLPPSLPSQTISQQNYNDINHHNHQNNKQYCQRQIDQLQKDIGYCNAVKMAIETRETILQQQLHKLQQSQSLQQQPSSQQQQQQQEEETEQLLQKVATLNIRIHELEQTLQETKLNHESDIITLQSSLTDALRRITEYEEQEHNAVTTIAAATTTTAAVTTACTERNEYLELRLEEAIENELRIDEMNHQIHQDKLYRINTQKATLVYEQQIIQYKERMEELEQQNIQYSNEIRQLSQSMIDKDQIVLELQQTIETYQEHIKQHELLNNQTTVQCQEEQKQLQQQLDVATNECYNHSRTLQYMLNVQIQQLQDTIQIERNERQRLEQLYDEKYIDWNDRIISYEQMLQEEIERSKQLTVTLQMEREEKQRKQPSTNTIHYHYYIQQLQQINQLYQQRHIKDNEKIYYLQNELYTLRYNIHTQNEIWRHLGIFDTFYVFLIHPMISWLYDPVYSRFLVPNIIQPIRLFVIPYYDMIMMIYIPQWNQFIMNAWTIFQVWYHTIVLVYTKMVYQQSMQFIIHVFTTLRIWFHMTIVNTNIAYQQYILPVLRLFNDSISIYSLYAYAFLIQVQGYLLHSVNVATDTTSQYMSTLWIVTQQYKDVIVDAVSVHVVPMGERLHSELSTITIIIDDWRMHLEQQIIHIGKNHGFDGTTCIQVFYTIHLFIGLSLLLFLIHRRRLRYVESEI